MELNVGDLNWIAIVVAAVVFYAIGALWYSPVLFGNAWMSLRGLTKEGMSKPHPLLYVGSFLTALVSAIITAVAIQLAGAEGAVEGLLIGVLLGVLAFVVVATNHIFENVKLKLHLITIGYHVVGLIVTGLILGVWQ